MLKHADDAPPIEIVDMDQVYWYTEYTWSIEYPDISPAPEYAENDWITGNPLMKIEVWGAPEELPWFHATNVEVTVPNVDENGEVYRYVEFEGEPHVTHEEFAPERSLEVAVVSNKFEVVGN